VYNDKQSERLDDALTNATVSLDLESNNWYFYDQQGHCYWSDCLRMSDTDQTVVMTEKQGYTYNLDSLAQAQGSNYSPIVLTEANIFMPYPESDVIQNPYFEQPAVEYNFKEE